MALRLIALYLALLGAAQAETLPDPTRPALGWDAASETAALPSGPHLQAIRTQDGIRSALISGQTVRIGARVDGALVTRIDEDRVWLRGPSGMQQLKLFPEVEKSSANPRTRPTARQGLRKEAE